MQTEQGLRKQLLTYYIALKLECTRGGKHGHSVLSIIKAKYGLKGSRVTVLTQLGHKLEAVGILPLGKTEKDVATIPVRTR